MFDVCLLGTGGMMPLPNRFLTACLMRYNGTGLLIDCGEGTQITMKKLGWSFKDIDYILFTHYHADHISGLPGLLLTIGNSDRTDPLTLIGPKGLRQVAEGLLRIAPGLPFPIAYHELSAEEIDGMQEIACKDIYIRAARMEHGVPCVGYRCEIKRLPKFDAERAKEQNIPLPYWKRLQVGETVTTPEGQVYTPDMVQGEARRGISLAYCTDTRPARTIPVLAKDVDLLICEGMYGDPLKKEKAAEHHHMNFEEAALLAKEAGAAELWLTHFSPAEPYPKQFLEEASRIFPKARVGKDRLIKEFKFKDEA